MPHALLAGPVSAGRAHAEVGPFEARDDAAIYKFRESFLSRGGGVVLVETVVVETTTRRFFIALEDHEGHLTVRLHALTDPEKTPGVKRALARLVRRLCALDPGVRVLRTNLSAEIEEVGS